MKRCPHCDFIYEDDQSLCDMDGVLLVFDSRVLPNLHAIAPVEVPVPAKAHWRHRTFPAMAALILATVLSLVYFVTTQRRPYPAAPVAPAAVETPIESAISTDQSLDALSTDQPADTAPTEQPADPNLLDASAEASGATEAKPETTTKSKISTPPKKSTVKSSTTEAKPAEEPKKDDSKVGSILKKTGRILKKPFKF